MRLILISIIFPSRARPDMLRKCGELLFEKAVRNIEIVVWFDDDDPMLKQNLQVVRDFNEKGWNFLYHIGNHGKGYADNHRMIEKCASLAKGDILMQYNDDMEMETQGWDEIYTQAIGNKLIVASARITTPDEGRNMGFRFSCPTIPLKLYNLCGMFCLGENPSVDRCWEAFAHHFPCEVQTEISIYHKHAGTGDEKAVRARQEFYDVFKKEVDQRFNEFDVIGKYFTYLVKKKLKEGG